MMIGPPSSPPFPSLRHHVGGEDCPLCVHPYHEAITSLNHPTKGQGTPSQGMKSRIQLMSF